MSFCEGPDGPCHDAHTLRLFSPHKIPAAYSAQRLPLVAIGASSGCLRGWPTRSHTLSTTLAPGHGARQTRRGRFRWRNALDRQIARGPHDIPQSITIINKALMQSQGASRWATPCATSLASPGCSRGRADRQQHQPQRLQRADRHLPGRFSRPGPVLPRHLRARRSRGSDGTVVDAFRARLDRWRDQPGDEEGAAQADHRGDRCPDHEWPGSQHRSTSIARCRRPPPCGSPLMAQDGAPTTRREMTVAGCRHRAIASPRHQHPH